MKKIVIKGHKEFGEQPEIPALVVMGDEGIEVSDGFHTMDELYEHRIVLYIKLAKAMCSKHIVWRSKMHSDGSSYDGWFILGINQDKGNQITYHLPDEFWEETTFALTEPFAPEFDGHTAGDVLERLKEL